MKISRKKAEKLVDMIKEEPYEPTLADCNRIYRDYAALNPGEVADCMREAFAYLSQPPLIKEYRGGMIYARAEISKDCEPVVHYVYLSDDFASEDSFGISEDLGYDFSSKLKEVLSDIKEFIGEDIAQSWD